MIILFLIYLHISYMKFFGVIIVFILFLFVNLLVVDSLSGWRNFSQILKDKLKTMYKKKIPRSKESVSVGPSSFSILDYPKSSEASNDVENLWKEYYKCLESKHNVISEKKSIFPYAVSAFTKTYIQLDCNVCVSPDDILEETEWYFASKPYISESVVVEEDEHKQISAFTFTLHLSDLDSSHQGMYFCHLRNDVDGPYFVHVLNSSVEPIAEVRPIGSKIGPFPQQPVKFTNTEISIWNDWTPWSGCSICGKIGKRMRIGYCNVGLAENLPNDIKNNLILSKENLNISVKVLQETENLMKYFVHGIPCRSSLLPKAFRSHPLISSFATEIMTGFCKTSCPSNVMFEIIDTDGNVVDKVNNSAGIYSVYQEIPPQLQTFQHVIQYTKLDDYSILSCPNLLHKDAPVQWSVAGKIWIKENVEKASHKRILMNNLNEIVVTRVEDIDVNKIYSCYQMKERIGAIELKIQSEPPILQSYIDGINIYTKIMFLCIFFTFSYVPLRMCLNQDKAAAGQYVPLKGELSVREFIIKMYHDTYIGEISDKNVKK